MKIIMLVGGGAKAYSKELNEYIYRNQMPVVYSLNGKGIVSDYYANNYGMIGSLGRPDANKLLAECDTIIAIGSRFDVKQMPDPSLLDDTSIIDTIDIDYNVGLDWVSKLNLIPNIKYPTSFNSLSKRLNTHTVTTDVGRNQMTCANQWMVDQVYKWVTSGGLGTMGFAIPAAIGVAVQGKPVVAICGDGGFQMNVQELETIVHNKLPIKIIVLNNNRLGLVRSFQHEQGLLKIGTEIGYSCPDIQRVTEAYGIKYITDENEFVNCNEACVLEI